MTYSNEAELERLFCAYVRSKGGLCLKQNASLYANIPDRAVFVPGGRAFLLEFKLPGEKLRRGQEQWVALARRRGHVVYMADDLNEAIYLYERTQALLLPKNRV